MSIVHVLDDNTINKIAAGEVVERPASVVKELIENSLDAKARRIEIEIMSGGTSLIRVSDDGIGMNPEDAKLSILRHATSKIAKADDLFDICSLGFRGEALPTIASVSKFSLVTRTENSELGSCIKIYGGKNTEYQEIGCKIGTTISVEDLFFNVPARKKFMKTVHTEMSKINDCVVKLALANPDVSFRLISNNKNVVLTPGNGSLRDTIQSIYGGKVGDSLLELNYSSEDGEIVSYGYISKPSMLRSNRAWQTFIINGRIIESKMLTKAIDNAYHSLLPKSGFPLVVLGMTLPQRKIDINVHPRKTEIKFEDEGSVFRLAYKAVLEAIRPDCQLLNDVAGVVSHPERHILPETSDRVIYVPQVSQQNLEASAYALNQSNFNVASTLEAMSDNNIGDFHLAEEKHNYSSSEMTVSNNIDRLWEEEPDKEDRLVMQPVCQIDLCYIIAKNDNDLYIVDQHAAHERILYDRCSAMTGDIPSQRLLVHPIMHFSEMEAELLEEYKLMLYSMGFEIEASGELEYRLMAVPMDIPVSDAETVVRVILQSLIETSAVDASQIRHACLAMTACKAAVKKGDELNLAQMQIILEELSQTSRPYTCPHGRPTILKFTSKELAKMFKRI